MGTTSGSPLKGTVFALTVGMLASVSIPLHGQLGNQLQDVQSFLNVPNSKGQNSSTQNSKGDAQTTSAIQVGKSQITGYPDDWSHHHVIFTDPGTETEAQHQGRHSEWQRVVNDPRYVLNRLKRGATVQGAAATSAASREATRAQLMQNLKQIIAEAKQSRGTDLFDTPFSDSPFSGSEKNQSTKQNATPASTSKSTSSSSSSTAATSSTSLEGKEDWNVPLTTGNNPPSETVLSVNLLDDSGGQLTTGTMQPNVYPAKYSFDPNGAMSCPNDYIVYPTGVPGVTTGDYTVPVISLLGINLGTDNVDGPGTPNIIAYNNLDTGILSGVTSCGTILAGVFDLNLLLNNNLSPNPTVMWAYNTGGAVTGSPVLSLDGSQIAYIQQTSSSSKTAQLVLLKWSSPGNSGAVDLNVDNLLTLGQEEPLNGNEYSYGVANIGLVSIGGLTTNYPPATAPTAASCSNAGGAYQTATAGQGTGTAGPAYMCVMTLKGTNPTVLQSNPFPDYQNGALYVGDDQGNLHMFTGLSFGFSGTAVGQASSTAAIAEAAPLNLSSYPLGAPAYDSVSGCIFVGDAAGVLYQVDPGFVGGSHCNSGTGALSLNAKTAQLASGTANGILDAPMVDSNNQAVYVFVSSSSTVGGIASGSNAVYEFQPGFKSSAAPVAAAAVGTGGSTLEFLDGDFDNVYYSSSNGTGNMYVVGNTHTLGNASLFQLPINNNVLGTPNNLGVLNTSSGAYAYASPVMEFCNNAGAPCEVSGGQTTAGVDIVYFSVYKGQGGILGGLSQVLTTTSCSVGSLVLLAGGCIYGVDVNSPALPILYDDYYTSWAGSAANPCWVTSGLVVDNSSVTLLGLNAVGAGSQMYYVGLNGNSDSLINNYDPCGTTKTTGNVIDAQQIGQGNLSL